LSPHARLPPHGTAGVPCLPAVLTLVFPFPHSLVVPPSAFPAAAPAAMTLLVAHARTTRALHNPLATDTIARTHSQRQTKIACPSRPPHITTPTLGTRLLRLRPSS